MKNLTVAFTYGRPVSASAELTEQFPCLPGSIKELGHVLENKAET